MEIKKIDRDNVEIRNVVVNVINRERLNFKKLAIENELREVNELLGAIDKDE